jgi:predicted small secreted protein
MDELALPGYVTSMKPGTGPDIRRVPIMSRLLATAFTVAILLGAAASLSACNTTAGVGQDVSSAGHAVTNAADSAKH